MNKEIKVYIASPYRGNESSNVSRQMKAFDDLVDYGFIPFIPLLFHFQHLYYPRTYEEWMTIDLEWVKSCDCLLRLQGDSKGADREEQIAKDNNIPVFYRLSKLKEHYYG